MIPRIIHQTWKTDSVPSEFQIYAWSWKMYNPTYKYILWTDGMLLDLIAMHEPQLKPFFKSLRLGAQKADVGRYVILKHIGGWYADLDSQCLRPLDDIPRVNEADMIVSGPQYRGLEIAVVGSVPQHPIWNVVLERLVNVEWRSMLPWYKQWGVTWIQAVHVLASTGPMLFDFCVREFLEMGEPRSEFIVILPHTSFYPNDVLFRWRSYDTSSSFAMHHSAKSWVDSSLDLAIVHSLSSDYFPYVFALCMLMLMYFLWKRYIRPRLMGNIQKTTLVPQTTEVV